MSKKLTIPELIAKIQSEHGADAITYGNALPPLTRVPTGVFDLDLLLDGGVPLGKLIQVTGLSKSGKSTLALTLLKNTGTVLYFDIERKFTQEHAELLGYTPEQVVVVHPSTLEEMFTILFKSLDYPLGGIILDSLPALVPKKELELKDMEKVAAVSPIAGLFSKKLTMVVAKIAHTGTVFVVVNPFRDKINAMPFGNPYNTPGGHQLKGLTTLTLTCAVKGQVKDDRLGNFGFIQAIMTEKNSLAAPMQRIELNYVYNLGFVGNVLEARNQLLLASGRTVRASNLDKSVSVDEVTEESDGT